MPCKKLTMLPSERFADLSTMPVMERDGFVDEAVVQALLTGPVISRPTADSDDLVLSVDDMDFAGWHLLNRPPASSTLAPAPPCAAAIKRPAPPEIEEPSVGSPPSGSHRWWVAGLAGALATMLFSILLLALFSLPQGSPCPNLEELPGIDAIP